MYESCGPSSGEIRKEVYVKYKIPMLKAHCVAFWGEKKFELRQSQKQLFFFANNELLYFHKEKVHL